MKFMLVHTELCSSFKWAPC